MYKHESAKKEYFKRRYQKKKDYYKKTQDNYWANYARKRLGIEDVTEEQIRLAKNEYYREYRAKNKEKVDAQRDQSFANNVDKI